MNIPQISVVMPAYNAEPYLREAIESIRNQTFDDYEFIIINDGSTDGTKEILDRFSEIDSRIKVFHQENRGVTPSLNLGCKHARGKYIARMDADDISLPTRFERQMDYLEQHPEIGVLGTSIELINEHGHVTEKWSTPTLPGLVRWNLTRGSSIAHSSVLMRRTVFEQLGGYDEQAKYVEDYDLWTRAVDLTKTANIPDVLLRYRIWGKSICATFKDDQFENMGKPINAYLNRILASQIDYDSIIAFRKYFSYRTLDDPQDSKSISRFLIRLLRAFEGDPSVAQEEIEEIRREVGKDLYYIIAVTSRMSTWTSLIVFFRSLAANPIAFMKVFLINVRRKLFGK